MAMRAVRVIAGTVAVLALCAAPPPLAAREQVVVVVADAGVSQLRGDCEVAVRGAVGQVRHGRCGERLLVPPGDYEAWVEWDDHISPTPTRFHVSSDAVPGKVVCPIARGQRRQFRAPADAEQLRVYSIDEAASGPQPLWKDCPLPDRGGCLLPPGRLLAVAKSATGEIVAISRSKRDGAIDELLSKPRTAHLFATLGTERLELAARTMKPEVVAAGLDGDGAVIEQAPDELFRAEGAWVAVWRDVRPARPRVRAESAAAFFESGPAAPRTQRIATISGALRALPTLHVQVIDPTASTPRSMRLRLMDEAKQQEVRTVAVSELPLVLTNVPPRRLRVALLVDGFVFERAVDLRDGADSSVLFEMSPIRVTGKVTQAGEPVRADITVRLREPQTIATNADGEFEVLLWQTGMIGFSVTAADGGTPFEEMRRITASTHLAIDIPANDFRVRTVDSESGNPVGGAVVQVRSRWTTLEEQADRSSMSRVVTKDDGEARFPPLRPGRVELRVTAPGYRTAEAASHDVPDTHATKVITVVMEKERAVARLHLQLPGGEPARAAQAFFFSDRGLVATATADAAGAVDVPVAASEVAVIKHAAAATRVIRTDEALRIQNIALAPPRPSLVVRVVDATGNGVDGALLCLIVEGFRFSGPSLALLAGTADRASPGGLWPMAAPPRQVLKVLAGRNAASLASGAHDHLALPLVESAAQPSITIVD